MKTPPPDLKLSMLFKGPLALAVLDARPDVVKSGAERLILLEIRDWWSDTMLAEMFSPCPTPCSTRGRSPMEISLDQLRSAYASRTSEDLLVLLAQGGLTQEAEMILMAELRARGYADQASARDAAVHAHAVEVETATREETERKARSLGPYLIAFFLIGGLFVCITVLAPFIWSSPADRACQKAGYWYAQSAGLTQIQCFGWKLK
jgi:hypothetical protein